MTDMFNRIRLSEEAKKDNQNNLAKDAIAILKKIKNRENTFNHSEQSEGYSDQDIKAMIIERTGKFGFRDKSLISKGLLLVSGLNASVSTTANLSNDIGQLLMGANINSSYYLIASLATFTTLYATSFISKIKDRNISEEAIVKKLFQDSDSDPEFKKSFKQSLDEYIHSNMGKFWATINKKALSFIENSKELFSLSKKIVTEAPKSLINNCISHITGNKNFFKKSNSEVYKKIVYDGTLYNQFFTDLNTSIQDIAKDKKSNKEIDKAIQKHYETVIKKTYEDMLVLNISQFSKQYILDLLENKNGSKYDKLKSLNDISQLSKEVSNNPLNKYTLISNVAKNFLDKYAKLSNSQFSLLAENSQQTLQDIIQEESELIRFNFKDQPDIIQGNFNVLFSNTLSSEKPLFKEIFKKHKEILIQEENEISELKSKNARKRTEHL
tara:strand:- start:5963 stop:7282 length:1320 start_codon:yes stop_codon:yes gene_type:complete